MNYMAKRRPSGDGMVRKREDGRWEGRIVVGHKGNGDSIFRYVYADTQKELTAKLRQHIETYRGIDLTEQSGMTLGEWLDQWLAGGGDHPWHPHRIPRSDEGGTAGQPHCQKSHRGSGAA